MRQNMISAKVSKKDTMFENYTLLTTQHGVCIIRYYISGINEQHVLPQSVIFEHQQFPQNLQVEQNVKGSYQSYMKTIIK